MALRVPWSLCWEAPNSSMEGVDAVDETHYPTRNVSDTGWKHRYEMDATLDVIAGECTRTDSADSPATAS
jgi:hypothetical protein